MRVRATVVGLVFVALAGGAACGSSSGKQGSSTGTTVDPASFVDKTSEGTVTIEARDDMFVPQYVKVRAGTHVVFENAGHNQHDVLSIDASFHDIQTAAFAPRTKVTVVLAKTGTHGFYCSLHGSATAGMNGAVLVVP